MYCGKYCVLFNGCVHVSVLALDTEFIVEPWERCGRVMEGVMKGLLLVMVILRLVVCKIK
jgi:hypothetical protein